MTDSFDYSDLVRSDPDAAQTAGAETEGGLADPGTFPQTSVEAEAEAEAANVLEALHMFRAAEAAMRRRTGTAMGLGENDLLALRFILDQRAAGHPVASKDVTRYLGISSASTTVLLRRLESGGFIERRENAADRRSSEIVPTRAAEGDTGPMLAVAQNSMAAATQTLSAEEARIITDFLTRMRSTVDRIGAK